MVVNRLKNASIENQGLFTAIFGQINDVFMGGDLRKYSFYQQLYLYLKTTGFDIVVFYDSADSFHSYSERDLALFHLPETVFQKSGNTRYTAHHVKSPLGGRLRNAQATAITDNSTIHQSIVSQDQGGSLYSRLKSDPEMYNRLRVLFNETEKKIALVIKTPSGTTLSEADAFESMFSQNYAEYYLKEIRHKIIITYPGETISDFIHQFDLHRGSNKTFFSSFFNALFLKKEGETSIPTGNCFEIKSPDLDEVRNFLNYFRLFDNDKILDLSKFNELAKAYYKGETNKLFSGRDLSRLSNEQVVKFMQSSRESGWEELHKMFGLSSIKKEIERVVKIQKYLHRTTSGVKTSRHMMLTGEPGTGKTEVARLIGRIFQEEGILSRGHFTEVRISDLKGQHVGETPIKTYQLIQKALGGVLYIDEAHNLASDDEFSKEALSILLKEMEDHRDDLVVILSGYQEGMERVLKVDPGMSSRIPFKFHFPGYSAEELYEIFLVMIRKEKWETTPAFRSAIFNSIQNIYKKKKEGFGNARAMREMVEKTRGLHILRCLEQELTEAEYTIEDIPQEYVMTGESIKNNYIKELEDMVGIQGVKIAIRQLMINIKAQKLRIERGHSDGTEIFDLNFVFTGNPGTGKTTVGRMLGGILQDIGVLESGHLVYTDREKLIAGYVGQTAIKTQEKIDEALGGVLFIDEAYSLLSGGDFGHEVIGQLLTVTTNPKYMGKMAIVLAGYPKPMADFIASNPGLFRRLPQVIHFDDYSSEDLVTIFENNLVRRKFMLEEGVKEKAFSFFESIPRNERFGNAGVATQLADTAISMLNSRIADIEEVSDQEMMTILAADIPDVGRQSDKVQTIEDKNEYTSLADEVLPKFDPANPVEIFIRSVCDQLEQVLSNTINAYERGEGYVEVLQEIENPSLQTSINEVLKYNGKYDLSTFNDIVEWTQTIRFFFRGVMLFNQNDIDGAVKSLKLSLDLADKHNIEGLQEICRFLVEYWTILIELSQGNLQEAREKLVDFDKKLINNDIGIQYKQMSDIIQSDILFVTALDALAKEDFSGFSISSKMAGEVAGKVADIYAQPEEPMYDFFKGLSEFYYSFNAVISIFHRIDKSDFNYTHDLANLSFHTMGGPPCQGYSGMNRFNKGSWSIVQNSMVRPPGWWLDSY